MSAWNIIVITAGLLLLIFIGRREFIRPNKARLLWRMLASVVAVVCLVCMGVPLHFHSNTSHTNTAIVITDGADEDSVQQFRNDQKQKPAIYQANDFFSTEHPLYDSLHVFGYGFSDEELQMLGGSKIIFHSSSIKSGITSIDWNRKIEKGKELIVQGTYQNQTALPVTLMLHGFNTILDSFTVPAKQQSPFRLKVVPKHNGKAVYSILGFQHKDTLAKEPLPVEVIAAVPVKVLMLAASPDFENRFLKDWLSQNGYTVFTKTAISVNKFDKNILNAGSQLLDRLTTNLLDSMDVLISDEAALLSLSKPEQENVYTQVIRKGMGMIIRSDTVTLSKEWFASSFQLYASQGKQPSYLSIHMGNDKMPRTVLPVAQPLFIRYKNGMQPLVLDSADNIVTGIVAHGAGKIAITTLTNTYSWMLSGNAGSYYSIWSDLLQQTARPKNPRVSAGAATSWPVQQQAVPVTIVSNENTPPLLLADGKQIAPAQNENLADHWQGTWWPGEAGWQSTGSAGMFNNWYVFGKHDWKHVMAQKKIGATRQYSQNTNDGIQNERVAGKPLSRRVPLVYFFLPFIICCGFLWLERKIF